MANEIVSKEGTEISAAYAGKDVAQSLRRYLETGDTKEEQRLVTELNANPTFWGRFFPTEGQKISRSISAETLRQIGKNKNEIMAAHHAMYIESTKAQANAVIRGLGVHLQEQLSTFVMNKIENIEKTIQESESRMLDRIMDKYAEAEKYKSNAKVYDAAIKSADKHLSVAMKASEELLDGTIDALQAKAGIK